MNENDEKVVHILKNIAQKLKGSEQLIKSAIEDLDKLWEINKKDE